MLKRSAVKKTMKGLVKFLAGVGLSLVIVGATFYIASSPSMSVPLALPLLLIMLVWAVFFRGRMKDLRSMSGQDGGSGSDL